MTEEITNIQDTFTDAEQRIYNVKQNGFNWQKRRHPDWTENYTLYRDKVIINRLTQRQSVNVPLMKQSIKTILTKVDDFPDVVFENLSNDKQKELFFQECWYDTVRIDKLEIKDIVDKKQVCLYGRSFKKLNIINGRFSASVEDTFDILVDRFCDPSDIDSAKFIIHQHIYRSLSDIMLNDMYDKSVIKELELYFATTAGLFKSAENQESQLNKQERMRQMGVEDLEYPQVGETTVELNEVFMKVWDKELEDEVIMFMVTAEGKIIFEARLEDVIGKTKDNFWRYHYPFSSWADDVERTDVWSDGVADVLRTPNKIVNAWLSQLVENRTLRNYGMNYYNSKLGKEGFVPQTFEPMPWGWYPFPGNPNEGIKRVEVEDLGNSIDDIQFVIQMAEKATAATAIQQGVSEGRKLTLGEVQLLFANSQERITSMSKFYNESWYDFALKYAKMLEAAGDKLDKVKLYKKSYKGNMFAQEIEPKDYIDDEGYRVIVRSKDEQLEEQLDGIQRLDAVKATMPDNTVLDGIYKERLLDMANLTPDEVREVMAFEEKKLESLLGEADSIEEAGNAMLGGGQDQLALPAGGMSEAGGGTMYMSALGENTRQLLQAA